MKNEPEYVEHCIELMTGLDESIFAKRMFGGHGIFREGLMFALVADSELYLKVDEENEADFARLDLPRFTYLRGGKEMHLSYRMAPDEAFQNQQKMRQWAGSGWEAAVRADQAKPPGKRKRQIPG